MTKRRTFSTLLAATLGLGATFVQAQTPNTDLQKQVEQLQAQVKELQAKSATPSFNGKDVDATVDSVLRDADHRSQLLAESGGFMGGWQDDRFWIRSADGNYSMSPGFQLQFRSVTTFNENAKASGDNNTDNGFEMRRMKFYVDGTAITKNLKYHLQWATDRKTGNLVLEESLVQYKFADNFAVKAGQFKEYIYGEQTVSSARQLFVDRSLLNEVLNGGESYLQGVELNYDNGSNLQATVGFTDGYASRNTNFQDPPTNGFDFGVHGRVNYAVMGDFKGYNSLSAIGNKKDFLVVGAGGDWSQNGDVDVFHHNIDASWQSGPWAVYAAYVGVYTNGGNGAGDNYDYGFVAQAGYLLNAQWEVAGRVDWFHLDNRGAGLEDSFWEITAGVNYYLKGHNAKINVDVGWLPNGSPNAQDGIGVLSNNGDNEFYIRGQFQLLL